MANSPKENGSIIANYTKNGKPGRPDWNVPKGRKEGRISRDSETTLLPKPTFNISQFQESFHQRGLSLDDLVALFGAHTLRFNHFSSFMDRIYNFNTTHDIDPTLRPSFAASLKGICPLKNREKRRKSNDPSPTTFDNAHYMLILQKKMDHSLLTTQKIKSQADLTGTCLKDEKTVEYQDMISGVFYSGMLLSYSGECDSTVLFQNSSQISKMSQST